MTTICGTRVYVLFVIELGTRRVRVVGVTGHPSGSWVAQRARECSIRMADDGVVPRFLIGDRDSKFTRAFDEVFGADGVRVVKTPVRVRLLLSDG